MYCWLVVNEFLNGNKYNEIYTMLKTALTKYGHSVDVYTNSELLICDGNFIDKTLRTPDKVIFWDKDTILARQLENMGLAVINSSLSIELCDNKAKTYTVLSEYDLPMPKTIPLPFTFSNIGYTDTKFTEYICDTLGLPLVAKPCFGSFGMGIKLINTVDEAKKLISECSEPMIFQEYIAVSKGRDVRINIVGNSAPASMLRTNDCDFRANITIGGTASPYTPSNEEKELAFKACNALGLTFGGGDLLFGSDGPLICEVNSNAHFKSIYDCTGINIAEEIAKIL